MAPQIRVIHLAHEIILRRAFVQLRLPGSRDIRQDHPFRFRQFADELGALRQAVLRIGKVCGGSAPSAPPMPIASWRSTKRIAN